ncbi:unnamed protein product [Bemisia tabaci]|uniref:Uncharacterized protein n=1 Tax=Bemisia tabaci TaxID=7038 RepID=A0A9P0A5J2_BEMTA|nr:unnamed protein product [Bemisia tabaci]
MGKDKPKLSEWPVTLTFLLSIQDTGFPWISHFVLSGCVCMGICGKVWLDDPADLPWRSPQREEDRLERCDRDRKIGRLDDDLVKPRLCSPELERSRSREEDRYTPLHVRMEEDRQLQTRLEEEKAAVHKRLSPEFSTQDVSEELMVYKLFFCSFSSQLELQKSA